MTQRTASMTFDLPQPFGPTTPVKLLGNVTAVGSTNDLNPASLIFVKRIEHTQMHADACCVRSVNYCDAGRAYRVTHNGSLNMSSQASNSVETFPNPQVITDYTIRMTIPEFTCLCPKTGQPDFATLELEYVPDKLCVELKSLKLYVWSFRDRGAFHEAVTNEIAAHLLAAMSPRYLRLTAKFNVRGGIYTSIVATHQQSGWRSPAAVQLP